MYRFCLLVVLFMIYSFLGYCVEVVSCSVLEKRLVFSRGYFIGPYLPIFGVGGMLFVLFFQKYRNDLFALFMVGMVSTCALEYVTSYLLEKIFKLRWWDYSYKKFHLNGRISLGTGILFGLAGIIIVCYVQPFLYSFLLSLPKNLIIISGFVSLFVLLVDFSFSTYTISKLKIDVSKYNSKDSTSYVRKEVLDSLRKYWFFYVRLFKSFPNILSNKGIIKIRELFEQKK